MTSLIDVIFLLLLFFMLTSTFSRYGELPLSTGTGGAAAPDAATPPAFLRLAEDRLELNGQGTALDDLDQALTKLHSSPDALRLLVSLADGTTAQRLTDLLVVLRPMENLSVTVLD